MSQIDWLIVKAGLVFILGGVYKPPEKPRILWIAFLVSLTLFAAAHVFSSVLLDPFVRHWVNGLPIITGLMIIGHPNYAGATDNTARKVMLFVGFLILTGWTINKIAV